MMANQMIMSSSLKDLIKILLKKNSIYKNPAKKSSNLYNTKKKSFKD
jgi:hypothetical protein